MSDELDRLYTAWADEQLEMNDKLPKDPGPDIAFRSDICEKEGHFKVKIIACRYCGETFGLEQDPNS